MEAGRADPAAGAGARAQPRRAAAAAAAARVDAGQRRPIAPGAAQVLPPSTLRRDAARPP